MSSMMEKIGEKLHIGGNKKEGEHKPQDPAAPAHHPPATTGHGYSTTPVPGDSHGVGHGTGTHGTEPHKEGHEGEKKHEGIFDKIKKKKKDPKERKERKEGDGSSSSSDSD